MVTTNELLAAFHAMSDAKYAEFNRAFGGGNIERESRAMQLVEDPNLERKFAQLLGLKTEEEKIAAAAEKSAGTASEAKRIATEADRTATEASRLATEADQTAKEANQIAARAVTVSYIAAIVAGIAAIAVVVSFFV